MYLQNRTQNGRTICEVLLAESLPARIRGLIGFAKHESALVIKTRFGIHTVGLRFPIDIVVLDADHRVRKIRKKFPPNRIFLYPPKFPFVIELPEGIINSQTIKLHDILQWS